MMQQMRENTKWIMLITALAFVGLMVFEWGMDMSGRSADALTGGELGTVNGESVTYGEFNQAYRGLYDQRQQQQGGGIDASENRAIEDQAWNQIVMDRLIAQELRRRGIEVTETEIRQAARFAPPPEFYSYPMFQTEGQFDLSKYHQFLSSPSADPQLLRNLESYYRSMIPRNKLFQQVASGVVVTDGELWRQYQERNETASMRFVALDPQALVADAEVTVEEREIAAYYSDNRDNFERPARAEVRVVSIDKQATPADTAASLEAARGLRRQIVSGEAEFEQLARQESRDEVSAQQGGALGTVRRGQTVAPFEEAVWSAQPGQVTEPVMTQFGLHLIRVDERNDSTAQVSHILLPVERTIESEDSMLARVDSLESMVERMSLEAAAEAVGQPVRTTEVNPLIGTLPGVGGIEEGLDWVFEQGIPVGEVSPVFENARYFYVMELVDREEARPLTLEEAHPTIETILRTERKRDRTRDVGRQLMDRLEGGVTLDQAAQAAGFTVREAGPFTRLDFVPGVGSGNAAIGAAFGLEVGETSGLIETPSGFFVVQVTDRTRADREAWQEQVEQQRQQVQTALQSQRLNQFLEALREEANVVDNRSRVLRAENTTES
jgi:peptidyl-prolyl cis-trans isomerase D